MNRKRHRGPGGQARANEQSTVDNACLSRTGRGCRCRIRRHLARGAVRQRLLDMGFIPDAEVEVLRVATLGDPIEVRVGDSFITLRKHEADQIEVSDS